MNISKEKKIHMPYKKWIYDIILKFTEFVRPCIFIVVCLFIIFCFADRINSWFETHILDYFENVSTSLATILSFTVLCLIIILLLALQIKRLFCYPRGLYVFLFLVVFIYSYFRIGFNYYAQPQLIGNLGYSDILCILTGISLLISFIFENHHHIPKPEPNQPQPFEIDRPIDQVSEDCLDHGALAKNIAERIKATSQIRGHAPNSNSTFSIALIAPWGSGKSSFINMLLTCFDTDSYLTFRFNPRYTYSGQSIQQSFFDNLKAVISNYDGQFSGVVDKYLEFLALIDKGFTSKALNLAQLSSNEKDYKEALSKIISRHWLEIIVVIEDFDRLTEDELIDTLKLIDGNASISGMVYVCAFDKQHVSKILGRHGSRYIDKYFDVEYSLPHRPYNQIYKYLEEKLAEIIGNDDYTKAEIYNCQKFFQRFLPTFRDAKRYINNVSISYPYVRGDVEILDFLLVEIIKLTDNDSYNYLKERNIIDEGNDFSDDEQLSKLIGIFHESGPLILKLVTRNKTDKSFNNPTHNRIYIWNNVYGKLRYSELEKLIDTRIQFKDNFSHYLNSLDNVIHNQVFQFISQFQFSSFKSKENLNRYISLVIFPFTLDSTSYNISNQYYELVLDLFHTERMMSIIPTIDISTDEYKNMILDKLTWKEDIHIPAYLNRQLIYSIITDHSMEKIITHTEMLKINCDNLHSYYEKNPEYTPFLYQLLLGCVESIDPDTQIVSLNKDCCCIVKESIIQNPLSYFDNFVGLTMISTSEDYNEIGCDGFWKQIFGDVQTIEKLINSLPREYILVKNFWILFKANDYDAIPFDRDGSVNLKIENNLEVERKRYDKFLYIRDEYKKAEQDYQFGLIDKNIYELKLKRIESILNKDIRLNISEVNRLHKDIIFKLRTL